METMHFHIFHTNLFLGQLCFVFGGPNEQFGTHEKLTWGCKVGLIGCLGIALDMLFSSGKDNFVLYLGVPMNNLAPMRS